MSKHTPGPWVVVPNLSASENHRGYRIVAKPRAFTIVTVQPLDEDGIEGGANASLIAAAPDLLDCLKELVALVRSEASCLLEEDSGGSAKLSMDIDAAIAKAEEPAR